jgi:adenosylhomocysteine nucleosidase
VSRLGIITGISSEAQCLAGAPADPSLHREIPLFRSAFGPAAAARAAQDLIEQGVEGLASAGIAGGLDPALRAGDLILPREVVGPERIYPVDPLWHDGLAGRLGGTIEQGRLLGVDVTIAGVAEKAALAKQYDARAVDMESHAVARVAAAAGLPFLAVRVVADPAGRTIPRAALQAVGPDGSLRPSAAIGALMLRPWELVGCLRLFADERAALRSLRRVASRAPLLGFGLRESLLDV